MPFREVNMKRRMISALSFILLCAGSAAGQTPSTHHKPTTHAAAASNQHFTPNCADPSLPGPATAIDQQCGLDGSGSGPEAKQNDAKNNFCGSGTLDPITIDQLRKLQIQVTNARSINFGDQNMGTRQRGPTRDPTI